MFIVDVVPVIVESENVSVYIVGPFTFEFLGSIVVSISACHAEDPGSIPGRGNLNLQVSQARARARAPGAADQR